MMEALNYAKLDYVSLGNHESDRTAGGWLTHPRCKFFGDFVTPTAILQQTDGIAFRTSIGSWFFSIFLGWPGHSINFPDLHRGLTWAKRNWKRDWPATKARLAKIL